MLLDKNELEALFRGFIDNDSFINRKKKRDTRKKIEKPLTFFLQYLFGDPTLTNKELDLRGERFVYHHTGAKDKEAYRTFEKLWGKFLLAEELVTARETIEASITNKEVASMEAKDIYKLSEAKIREKIIPITGQITENEDRVGVTSHAQHKLLNIHYLMAKLGIKAREIEEANYKTETTKEEQRAIEKLGRRIYGKSELIKVGNSNGRKGIFRYYYHSEYNLIVILPEGEEQIVTIYKAYIDRSMAEEILLEKKRNKEIHSATLRETQISYRRINDLLEYRKRQLDILEQQKEALGSSIKVIEESFVQNSQDINRIINEKKFLS